MKISIANINLSAIRPITERREREIFSSSNWNWHISRMTSHDGAVLLYKVNCKVHLPNPSDFESNLLDISTLSSNTKAGITIEPILGIVKVQNMLGQIHYRIWSRGLIYGKEFNIDRIDTDRNAGIKPRPEFESILFNKSFFTEEEIEKTFKLIDAYSATFGIDPVDVYSDTITSSAIHDTEKLVNELKSCYSTYTGNNVAVFDTYAQCLVFIENWKKKVLPVCIDSCRETIISSLNKIENKYRKTMKTAAEKIKRVGIVKEYVHQRNSLTNNVEVADSAKPLKIEIDIEKEKAIAELARLKAELENPTPKTECKFADKCIFGPNGSANK